MPPLSLLLILAYLGVATGFQSRNSVRFGMVSSQVRSLPRHPLQLTPSDLDATQLMIVNLEPLRDYVKFWAELFKPLNLPEPLVHWGHGAAMTTVLVAMGGIGTFLGWKIRQGDGAAQYAFTLGKTAREQHPLIMGLMAFFFLLGGQGGLVLLTVEGQNILESPHAITAAAGLGLLAVQAALPAFFKGQQNKSLRSVHAYLGTATMALLVVHAVFGYQLGQTF